MSTAAVKITDAEIKRQAACTVRDLRDVENRGLLSAFHSGPRPCVVVPGAQGEMEPRRQLP